MSDPTLFAGTAGYYRRYRTGYPRPLLDAMAALAPPGGRVLDLGCGPGTLSIPLAEHGLLVTALDADAGMIDEARAATPDALRDRIRYVHDVAERLREHDRGSFDLVVFGQSAHWMDRPAMWALLDGVLGPDRAIALTGGGKPADGTPPWQPVIDDMIARYLGPRRRAGSGFYHEPGRHEPSLLASAFSELHETTFDWWLARDLDDVVGELYSTSFCSPVLLGARHEEFDRELRAALQAAHPGGDFGVLLRAELLVATRPGSRRP